MKYDKPQDSTSFDPPVRMTDNGRHIHVTIGLPGIAEEQIRIDLERTTFTLSISENGRTFEKFLQVPQGVRVFRKKFSGGVLEISLEKPVP